MWKVANCARLEMRPRGTGDQPGNKRRGKMKDRQTYRTKIPNFSHQLEHVGPNKQISDIYLLTPTRINLAYNAKTTCFGNIY